MPERLLDKTFEEWRGPLVQFLKSSSATIESHATRLKELTEAVKVHDTDMTKCLEELVGMNGKMIEMVQTLKQHWDRVNEIVELLNRHTLLLMTMWRHLGLPVSADGSPMVG